MKPRLLLFALVAMTLLLGLAVGVTRPAAAEDEPSHVIDTWVPGDLADDNTRALSGSYTGFGADTIGGEGRPLFTVTSLADSGIGSLRSVLEAIGRLGGGRVTFAVAGDAVLLAELVVPANTTLDGLTAPAPGITLWGDRLGAGGGVLEINASNVIVRGLRIRNAVGDGIQIAAKRGVSVARIVVDHCSITNSGDGGIDVTGSDGLLVRDVTLSWNYLAANGGPCANKTWCGGGSLVKYGVTRFSAHANVWDKNLRRNPSIDGGAVDGGTLADVRGNVVGGYVESGTQLRDGARGNVVGNFFAGARPLLTAGASVFAAGNAGASTASESAPYDVIGPLGAVTREAVLAGAGAPALDAIDAAYRNGLATYEDAKNALVGPGIGVDGTTLGVDGALAETAAPPLDATTLAHAERALRLARTARTRREPARATAEYQAVLELLADARGMLVRPAEAVMASAALGLSELADPQTPAAFTLAESALAHAHRSGDTGLERRVRHRLRRLSR